LEKLGDNELVQICLEDGRFKAGDVDPFKIGTHILQVVDYNLGLMANTGATNLNIYVTST
jgi:hypothetical protein